MRAVIIKEFGGPGVLEIVDTPNPVPDKEQLLVHVKASALNRADLLQRRGKYPPPKGESEVPGLEIAGEVVELGSASHQFNIGDAVCGLVGGGAYAEYCLIDQGTAMLIPKTLSFVDAAAIPEAFLTAQEALFTLGALQRFESIVIHAGGSGVSTAAIQLARVLHAKIYTTVGSDDKALKAAALGAEVVINYKEKNFAEAIDEHIDIIIDFIGADYFARNLSLLNLGGRLIQVGTLSGAHTEIDLGLLLKQRLQIKGLKMRSMPLKEKRAITQNFINNWLPLFENGTLKPIIDSVFPLDEVQSAHQRMEANANFGKIVLTI